MRRATVTIASDGRIILPKWMRNALGIAPGTKLFAQATRGELRLVPQGVAIGRLRAMVKVRDKGKGSAVDELIADRRRET